MSEEITGLEGELRSNGIHVESLDLGEPVELTYMTAFPGPSVHHQEMGRVLNTFIDAAANDEWDPVRIEATVVRAPGDVQGTWHARGEWFEALADYRISETEFSTRVLDTLEEDDAASGERAPPSDEPDRTPE